jgi:hypothetical protein
MESKPIEYISSLKVNFKSYTPAIIFILDNCHGQGIEIAVRRSNGKSADR